MFISFFVFLCLFSIFLSLQAPKWHQWSTLTSLIRQKGPFSVSLGLSIFGLTQVSVTTQWTPHSTTEWRWTVSEDPVKDVITECSWAPPGAPLLLLNCNNTYPAYNETDWHVQTWYRMLYPNLFCANLWCTNYYVKKRTGTSKAVCFMPGMLSTLTMLRCGHCIEEIHTNTSVQAPTERRQVHA